MGDLTAQAAADTALDDAGDGIGAQRIGVGLDGERRAAGEADAGMIARADLVVDAVAHLDHALAARELARILGAHPALSRELSFAAGADHLEAPLGGLHRLLPAPPHARAA